jgi:hypothetical protein
MVSEFMGVVIRIPVDSVEIKILVPKMINLSALCLVGEGY